MSLNPNWSRWLFASFAKSFQTIAVANNIPFFVEGQDRDTINLQSYYEFRMDGPSCKELCKDWWQLDVALNILITFKRTDGDIYKVNTITGLIASGFIEGVQIFKYGNEVGDDKSFIGCATLTKHLNDSIFITQLGQLQPDVTEMQTSVEGYYRLLLDTAP